MTPVPKLIRPEFELFGLTVGISLSFLGKILLRKSAWAGFCLQYSGTRVFCHLTIGEHEFWISSVFALKSKVQKRKPPINNLTWGFSVASADNGSFVFTFDSFCDRTQPKLTWVWDERKIILRVWDACSRSNLIVAYPHQVSIFVGIRGL